METGPNEDEEATAAAAAAAIVSDSTVQPLLRRIRFLWHDHMFQVSILLLGFAVPAVAQREASNLPGFGKEPLLPCARELLTPSSLFLLLRTADIPG